MPRRNADGKRHGACPRQANGDCPRRFYSGVVEKDAVVKAVVAAYIGYNPVKAKIADVPESWKWNSYALAVNDQGPDGERCRQMYERMLGRPWDEVRATLESMFADKLPD